MKISVWRQFSSNHSGDFSIVGTFESPEKAAEAAEKIRHILREVATFWGGLTEEEREAWELRPENELTPIEQQLSREYAVSWGYGSPFRLDWIPFDPDQAAAAVVLFENSVFVQNFGNTWAGAEPFDTLLKRWGATVAGSHELLGTALGVTVTCLAPDEATAERLITDYKVEWEDNDGVIKNRDLLIAGRFGVMDQQNIRREGLKLIYPLDYFEEWKVDFPVFIQYLRDHGCTQIEYLFRQD